MKTSKNEISAFEAYSELELPRELKMEILAKKNSILRVRYPNNCFTTDEHEQALIEACASKLILL